MSNRPTARRSFLDRLRRRLAGTDRVTLDRHRRAMHALAPKAER